MASDQNFVDFVLEHIENVGEVTAKKMFGEYSIYADGKLFGMICDNKLFIKPTILDEYLLEMSLKHHPTKGLNLAF
jgi:TfoX/Sxy family transcriptional regulator of competence genes